MNNLTGATYSLSLPRDIESRAPSPEVREITMSCGKATGLLITCPCGWDIIIDPRWYQITHVGGKLTLDKPVTHNTPTGCGWAARVVDGQLIPINVSKEPENNGEEGSPSA